MTSEGSLDSLKRSSIRFIETPRMGGSSVGIPSKFFLFLISVMLAWLLYSWLK